MKSSKYKFYLPGEEELLRELNQGYQALEVGNVEEENIYGMVEFVPPWAKRLELRADGYETMFYKKD